MWMGPRLVRPTLSVSRTTIEGTHAARDERFCPSAKRRVERARSGGREVVLSYGYFDVPRVVHHDSWSTWASGAAVCRISAGLEAATVASSAGVFRSCGVSSERSGQISAGPGWLEARVG